MNNGQTRSIEPIQFLNHGRSDGALDALFEEIRSLGVEDVLEVGDVFNALGITNEETLIVKILDIIDNISNVPLAGELAELVLETFNEGIVALHQPRVFGTPLASMVTANQCPIHFGGGLQNSLDKTIRDDKTRIPFIDEDGQPTEECVKDVVMNPLTGVEYKFYPEEEEREKSKQCSPHASKTSVKTNLIYTNVDLKYPSRTSYEACHGFRTRDNFIDFEKKALTGDSSQTKSEPDLGSINLGGGVNLFQALSADPDFTGIDSKDWHAISSYLLANPVKSQFVIENPVEGSNVRRVVLNVDKDFTSTANGQSNFINSLIFHNNPSSERIRNAYLGAGVDLPFDQKPYLSFLNKNGKKETLVIPDPFTLGSFDAFMTELENVESFFTEISKTNSDYSGFLTGLFLAEEQFNANDDLESAKIPKVEFLINFLGLSLNQKYQSAFKNILNQNFDPSQKINNIKNLDYAFVAGNFSDQALKLSMMDSSFDSEQEFAFLSQSKTPATSKASDEQGSCIGGAGVDQKRCLIKINEIDDIGSPYITDYIPDYVDEQGDILSNLLNFATPSFESFKSFSKVIKEKTEAVNINLPELIISGNRESIVLEALDANDKLMFAPIGEFRIQASNNIKIDLPNSFKNDDGSFNLEFNNQNLQINLEFLEAGDAQIKVIYILDEENQEFIKNFKIQDDYNVQFSEESIIADAKNPGTKILQFSVFDQNNQKIELNPPKISVDGPNILSPKIKTNQKTTDHTLEIQTTEVGGEGDLVFDFNGLKKSLAYNVEFLDTAFIKVSDQDKIIEPSNESQSVIIQKLDINGNPTNAESEIQIQNLNPEKISLLTNNLRFNNSRAQIDFRTIGQPSGSAFIKLSSNDFDDTFIKLRLGASVDLFTNEYKSNSLVYDFATSTSLYDSEFLKAIMLSGRTQVSHILSKNLSGVNLGLSLNQKGGVASISNNFTSNTQLNGSSIISKFFDEKEIPVVTVETDLSDLIITDNSDDAIFIDSIHPKAEFSNNILSFNGEKIFDTDALKLFGGASFSLTNQQQVAEYEILLQGERVAVLNIKEIKNNKVKLLPFFENTNYQVQVSFSGVDTNSLKTFNFVKSNNSNFEPEIPRAENRLNKALVGLNQTDKSAMLFASGMTFSKSKAAFLADSSIVFGDPTIKIQKASKVALSQMKFNQSLGEFKTRLDAYATQILPVGDFVLITDANGNLSTYNKELDVLEKNILTLHSKIDSIEKLDTQTGQKFILKMQDHCYIKDSCLLVFSPLSEEKFEPLKFNNEFKAKKLFIGKANPDSNTDLFLVNDSNEVFISLQKNDGTFTEPKRVARGAIKIPNNGKVITENLFVLSNVLDADQKSVGQKLEAVQSNSDFNGSFMSFNDTNGAFLQKDDPIQLNIKVNNSTNSRQEITAKIPPFIKVRQVPNGMKLEGANLEFTVGSNSTASFTIDSIYDFGADLEPKILIQNNPDASNGDDLDDIRFNFPNNVQVFYNSNFENGRLTYTREQSLLGNTNSVEVEEPQILTDLKSFASTAEGLDPDTPLTEEQQSALKTKSFAALKSAVDKDTDGDGIIDVMDSASSKLGDFNSSLADTIKEFTCDGGCLVTPINKAFLASSEISPGAPIFGYTPPFVFSAGPPAAFLTFHLYFSFTLTGEFVLAPCSGVYPASLCIPIKVADLGPLCEKINNAVLGLVNKAADFAVSESGLGGVISLEKGKPNLPAKNTPIKGFPSLLTDWVANQIAELVKFVDLPDITFIYPRFSDLVTRVPTAASESSLRKASKIEDESVNVFSLCENFVPYTAICGNVGTEQEFLKLKEANSITYNVANYATSLQKEFEDLPILNVNPVSTNLSYPMVSENELVRFILSIGQALDKYVFDFKQAMKDWACMDPNPAHPDDAIFNALLSDDDPRKYKEKLSSEGVKIEDAQPKRFKQVKFKRDDEGVGEFILDLLVNGRMVSYLQAKNESPNQKSQACLDLAVGFGGIVGNLDKNLKTILSYRDIPLDILEIQNFAAMYAANVLDYVILVLDSFYGYVNRQINILGEWLTSVEELLTILDSFQMIFKVFIDFQNSCDTCQSNRTNTGMNLIIDLLMGALPDLPVIRFPSLFPDLTIDVSELALSFDFDLPQLKFVPNYITLPDVLPTIILPERPPIGLKAQIEGLEVPLLPEVPDFKALIEFEPLPALELPPLPNLPEPPKVGKIGIDIKQKLQVPLEFISTVLELYCLYKKGFMPVAGPMLASQIETMTNRPLVPVLPIDLTFNINVPNLTSQYLAEKQFILTSDLRFAFPQIAELTKEFIGFVDEFSQEVKNEVQDFVNQLGKFSELEIKVLEQVEDLDLTVNENIDLTMNNHYEVKVKPKKSLPKVFNNNIDLIALNQKFENLPESTRKNLAPLYLSANNIPYETKNQSENAIASLDKPSNNIPLTQKTISLASLQTEAPNLSDSMQASSQSDEKGIMFLDENNLVSPLISYKQNDVSGSQVAISNLDSDSDEDVIYNIGKDIFIKKNQAQDLQDLQTASIRNIQFDSIIESSPSKLILAKHEFNQSVDVNLVSIQKPNQATDQIIVLDVYETNFDQAKPFNRYISNPLDSPDEFVVMDSYDFSNQVEIDRGEFNNIILVNSDSNQININLPNNPYIIIPRIYNVQTKKLDILGSKIPVTPSECLDRKSPLINFNQKELQSLSIFQQASIDLSESKDLETEIVKIYLDQNPKEDNDQDGDPSNDVDLIGSNDPNVRKFRIGPFNKITKDSFVVNAIDKVGNHAKRNLDLNIGLPEIELKKSSENELEGKVSPPFKNANIELIRERNNQTQVFAELKTDEEGKFKYNSNASLDDKDSLVIRDSNSIEHFYINKLNANVIAVSEQASINIINASDQQENTFIQLLVDSKEVTVLQKIIEPLLNVLLVNSEDELYSNKSVTLLDSDETDSIVAQILPATHDTFFGGAVIFEGDQALITVDKDGTIFTNENDISIKLEEIDNINQKQAFEIFKSNKMIFKVFVPISESKLNSGISEFSSRRFVDQSTLKSKPIEITNGDFNDLPSNKEEADAIKLLQDAKIVEGNLIEGQLQFRPDDFLNRAEYAKVILSMMCVEPSLEAFKEPQVFSDIPFSQSNLAWFYPITKETFMRGIFEGYTGEKDPITQLSPFKPANKISKIEAVKVIMEVLDKQGVIDTSNIEFLEPWYLDFLKFSKDLSPILTDQSNTRSAFLLTEQEALTPESIITRKEFAVIVSRALDLFTCDKIKANIEDSKEQNSSKEIDTSSQNNDLGEKSATELDLAELENSDSVDKQVLKDIIERNNRYNPPKSAINLGEISCNVCPCPYTINEKAPVAENDKVFAVLRNEDKTEIIQLSNGIKFD